MIAGDSLYLFSTLSRKLMALPGFITCQHEKRLRLCSSFAGVDCDYSDLLTITGLCSARSSDTSEESFGLLRCCCLVTQSCPTLCDLMDCSPASSSVHGILQARVGVGGHSLLQGMFPTWGSNAGLPHCRQILYHLSYQGKPLGFFQFSSVQLLSRVQLFATP